jgi:hypothetical protein
MCSSILDFFGFGYCLFDRVTDEERAEILPQQNSISLFKNNDEETPEQKYKSLRQELDIAFRAHEQLKNNSSIPRKKRISAELRFESYQRKLDKLQEAHPNLITMAPF